MKLVKICSGRARLISAELSELDRPPFSQYGHDFSLSLATAPSVIINTLVIV